MKCVECGEEAEHKEGCSIGLTQKMREDWCEQMVAEAITLGYESSPALANDIKVAWAKRIIG